MRHFLIGASLGALLSLAAPARAQDTSATERLIELLVQKGVLPRAEATQLLAQAAREARGPVAKPRAAKVKAPPPEEEHVEPGSVRVTYVPQIVRQQIADQVRQQVMDEAKAEGWAEPNVLPEWVQRVRVIGDLRMRGEEDLFQHAISGSDPYSGGNYNRFPDINAINNGGGYNGNFNTPGAPDAPTLNSTENRTRERIRARVGFDADLDTWLTSEIRIGTGDQAGPVSPNATLGTNGGNFSKYAIWLDRAYIRAAYAPYLAVNVGRGPNPFWTSDLMYYDFLNFDGIAAQGSYKFNDRVGAFLTAGAFPVFNTGFALATTSYPDKGASRDKYLFAVQGGGDVRITEKSAVKLAVGYFAYSNIEGKTSTPCEILLSSNVCDTDASAANFVQFGNTVYGIRNFINDPNNLTGAQPQLYGLASQFGILDVHARYDINAFDPVGISLEGDYAKNTLFNRASVLSHNPINNFGSGPDANANGPYQGGDTGYLLRLTVGTPQIEKLWDWNVSLTYKYIGSDAVLDALNDPDFHLGGTNAKGYIIGANLGIARNTYLTARWLSANAVSGPPYAVDVLQLDLNARF